MISPQIVSINDRTIFLGADLTDANLDVADLSGADLTNAIAKEITFIDGLAIGATVTNADFSNSTLIKSNFTDAVDINTAILTGADTTDAIGI